MIGWLLEAASGTKAWLERLRLQRRWEHLRGLGMHIGKDVNLPALTWADYSHCYLISIGDHCGFGEGCFLLAHDAQMDEFLDAARIGRIIIHPSCHVGTRTIILPGVEIGPRTILGAGSVVTRCLPPDTVCAGVPAKVLCTVEVYLTKHRIRPLRHPGAARGVGAGGGRRGYLFHWRAFGRVAWRGGHDANRLAALTLGRGGYRIPRVSGIYLNSYTSAALGATRQGSVA